MLLNELYSVKNLCIILEDYCKNKKENELADMILPLVAHINKDLDEFAEDFQNETFDNY